MAGHIGIVACSVPGALLCYSTIAQFGKKYFGEWGHPQISLHNHPLSDYMVSIKNGDWEEVGRLMQDSANKLKSNGANILITPDNTIHQAMKFIKPDTDIEWLHIAKVVREEAVNKKYHSIAVTGTKYLMEGPVYLDEFEEYDILHYIPDEIIRRKIDDYIFSELVYNYVSPEAVDFFYHIISDFKELEFDAVVAGCTEIPLITDAIDKKYGLPLPVLDSTRLLAKAALMLAFEVEG